MEVEKCAQSEKATYKCELLFLKVIIYVFGCVKLIKVFVL